MAPVTTSKGITQENSVTKKQINVRGAKLTHDQLDQLMASTGATKGEVIMMAVDRMHRETTRKEKRAMSGNYRIDADKLARVTEIVNRDTDPKATEALIESEICADWAEGDEHQAWIDKATPAEIADWIASFYEN